jgi:ketopantoate reductase
MTRIAVYGAGGIGGYFGVRLARAGAEVLLIARGAHLLALREGHAVRRYRCTTPSSAGPGPWVTRRRMVQVLRTTSMDDALRGQDHDSL